MKIYGTILAIGLFMQYLPTNAQCIPRVNESFKRARERMIETADEFLNEAILGLDLEKLRDMMVPYDFENPENGPTFCASGRFFIGCYHNDGVISYNKLVNPINELVNFSRPAVFHRVHADIEKRSLGIESSWDIYSWHAKAEDGVTPAPRWFNDVFHLLQIYFDCDYKIKTFIAIADTLVFDQANMPPLSDYNVERICNGTVSNPGIMRACTGANQVYASVEACKAYLSSVPNEAMTAPFGFGNSIACRDWHLNLARNDPEMHCSHVSPGGGDKCCDQGETCHWHF